ncbi:MAG: TldD/PmbA family protein [Actinomycetota bacterium]
MTDVAIDTDLLGLADRIVGWADDDEQLEAYAVRGRDTEIRAYQGEVESFTSAESAGVGIRVIRGGRQGFAYAGSLDLDVIEETLSEARDNATFATPEDWVGLVEPDGVTPADLELWSDSLAGVSDDRKIELALELEAAASGVDPRISAVESADYADSMVDAAIATTSGIRDSARRSGCYVTAFVLASEGDETQTGFGFSVGRDLDELVVGDAAADAGRRATQLLGATKPESERLTVVFDPYVTAQLLGIIGGTLNAESVLKGRSLFAERLGEEVAAADVTLVDDPTDDRFFTAGRLDGEGLATRRNELIVGGELQQFVHNGTTARRMGTASTGSAVRGGYASTPGVGCRALTLAPGTQTRDELIAGVERGVLIQKVAGLHSGVNPVSGDFSTGAEGVRIEGGKLGEPVREFTIASTLQRLLLDIVAIGSDVEFLPMSAAGQSVVIEGVTVSGR